ncbi:MAG: glycosyltransferase [Candidatus Melainabacteria bacterium]|nr:MAG: glycosyltransferase [Candidatus Melainabacteria bacterium]
MNNENLNNLSDKQNQILVSVVMPVFNHPENRLIEAIKSILNQSYQNIQFIIVDGCKSNKIMKSFKNLIIPKFHITKLADIQIV